jgi:serine phosphatase RsbU (regulator of sigma subunit)
VFPQATGLLDHIDDAYVATAALVEIDTAARRLRYATAGHPPPLLRTPAGAIRLLEHANVPVIGVAVTPRTAPPEPFPAGSVLVMYTDGLVERRGESLDAGLERLVGALDAAARDATGAAAPADAIADHLLRTLLDEETLGDDVALTVVRHIPPARST